MIIPDSLLLRMRNVSDKICRENQMMHFKNLVTVPLSPHTPPENLAIYWIIWQLWYG